MKVCSLEKEMEKGPADPQICYDTSYIQRSAVGGVPVPFRFRAQALTTDLEKVIGSNLSMR